MEQAGLWEGTTVIWSSDHPFRHRPALDGKTVSHRVPYLIKPAGVGQPVRYERPFSALMTRKLIEALLSREITRGGEIADWIDGHRIGLGVHAGEVARPDSRGVEGRAPLAPPPS